MDAVFMLVGLAAMFGGVGLGLGMLAGAGVIRWARSKDREGWIVAGALAIVVLGIGIWLTTMIQTVPKNAADARAHDYSLAGLWIILGLWLTFVNAVGIVVGVRLAIRWNRKRFRLPPGYAAHPNGPSST